MGAVVHNDHPWAGLVAGTTGLPFGVAPTPAPGIVGLDLDFANGRYALNSPYRNTPGDIPGWSFSRTGAGTAETSSGTVLSFATGVPRIVPGRGMLVEEARTNSIRNSEATGAAVGTPGTPPTSWALRNTSDGITRQVVGIGSINGLQYIDVRFFGTATSTITINVEGEGSTSIAATPGQTWTHSAWGALLAGTLPRSWQVGVIERSGAGVFLASTNAPVSLTSALTRFSATRTLNNPATAFVAPFFRMDPQVGDVIDFTIRVAAPQLELGAFPTSYIPTTGSATARGRDDAFLSGLILDGASITLVAEGEFVTQDPGNDAAIATIANAANDGQVTIGAWRNPNGNAFIQTRHAGIGSAVSYGVQSRPGNVTLKMAAALEGSSGRSAINGVLGIPGVVTTPAGLTRLNLGEGFGASRTFNSYVRRVRILPYVANDAELQVLTS